MFALLRVLFVLILIGYAFCLWKSWQGEARWRWWRRLFACCGLLLALLVVVPLLVQRFTL